MHQNEHLITAGNGSENKTTFNHAPSSVQEKVTEIIHKGKNLGMRYGAPYEEGQGDEKGICF